jgi:hypothetical protein
MSIELVARAKKTKLHGDSTAKLLLIVLADYANDDGMAWPSVATMAQEVEKSERSIQLLLRKLEAKGLIRKGDQKLVGKYAKGRRPGVYKLFPKKTKTEKPEEPHDDTENRGEASFTPETGFTGETDCAPRVKPASPHGRNPLHPTGETHFALGVKPISPKPSKEPSIEPSRESTRAKKPKPKTKTTDSCQALADFQPDESHRKLAEAIGLDLDYELAKFQDATAANGKYPADPAAAFRNWLRRGKELNLGTSSQSAPPLAGGNGFGPTRAAHRHTWCCEHVLRLLCRSRDTANEIGPDDASCRLAKLLNDGKPDAEALRELGLNPDELEAIA